MRLRSLLPLLSTSALLLTACEGEKPKEQVGESLAKAQAALCPSSPGTQLNWVNTTPTSGLPQGAVATGSEPSNPRIYSCLIQDGAQTIPGKLVFGRCHYSLNGRELTPTSSSYQVMTSPDASGLKWQANTTAGAVPSNAIRAGLDASGQPFVICRGEFGAGRHPGYLRGNACSVAWGGQERLLSTYEILVDSLGDSFSSDALCVSSCKDPLPISYAGTTSGTIPPNAVVVGQESTNPQIYACLAALGNGPNEIVYPGKVVSNQCAITVNGRQEFLNVFQVLTAPDPSGLTWVAGTGTTPPGAVQAGRNAAGEPFTLCRGTFGSGSVGPGVHPGYVKGNACSIGWGFQEILLSDYEVLVNQSPRPLIDLDGKTCVAACTPPSTPVDGVCTCPPNTVLSNGQCLACPPGSVVVDGQCVACPPGSIVVDGQCVACPPDSISVNGQCVACPPGQKPVNNVCVESDPDNPGISASIGIVDSGTSLPLKSWPLSIQAAKLTAYLLGAQQTPYVLYQPGDPMGIGSKVVPVPLVKDQCNVIRLVLDMTDQNGVARTFSTQDPPQPAYSTEQPFDPYAMFSQLRYSAHPITTGGPTLVQESTFVGDFQWDVLAWNGGSYTLGGKSFGAFVNVHNPSSLPGAPAFPSRSTARYPWVIEGINGNVCPPAGTGPYTNRW